MVMSRKPGSMQDPRIKQAYLDTDSIPVNSSTVPIDSDLEVALVANKTYAWWCCMLYKSGGTEDFKGAIQAGANSGSADGSGWCGATSSNTSYRDYGANPSSGQQWSGGIRSTYMFGTIKTTANGNLTVQWAQLVAGLADTILAKGSCLIVREVNNLV